MATPADRKGVEEEEGREGEGVRGVGGLSVATQALWTQWDTKLRV